MTPTGDETSKAAAVMARPTAPLFLVTAPAGRQAQRAVFAGVDKLQNFGDRSVFARHRLH
jgi:hypothetical protein